MRQALAPQQAQAQPQGLPYPKWLTDLVPWLLPDASRETDWAEMEVNKVSVTFFLEGA